VKNKRGQYFSVKNAFEELKMRKTKADKGRSSGHSGEV
jgi:hypothetical protein